jgi:hypothetical protein
MGIQGVAEPLIDPLVDENSHLRFLDTSCEIRQCRAVLDENCNRVLEAAEEKAVIGG